MASPQRLFHEVMALPADERARLADQLLASLDAEIAPEIEAAWAEEIERRIKSIDEGRVKLIPAEDVFRELKDRRR